MRMPALLERQAPYVTRSRRPASRLAGMRSRPRWCAESLLGEQPPAYTAPPSASLPDALTERDLAHLWEGQRFPPQALTMVSGQPLQVIYRGLRGRGPGPDFRDAVIIAPWGTLKGDVELHVRTSDFRRHGHHRDHAYDRLVLHLVYWPDERQDTTLASGRRVPVAALAPWLERRSEGAPPLAGAARPVERALPQRQRPYGQRGGRKRPRPAGRDSLPPQDSRTPPRAQPPGRPRRGSVPGVAGGDGLRGQP